MTAHPTTAATARPHHRRATRAPTPPSRQPRAHTTVAPTARRWRRANRAAATSCQPRGGAAAMGVGFSARRRGNGGVGGSGGRARSRTSCASSSTRAATFGSRAGPARRTARTHHPSVARGAISRGRSSHARRLRAVVGRGRRRATRFVRFVWCHRDTHEDTGRASRRGAARRFV